MTDRTVTTEATGQCAAMPDLATVEAVVIGEGDTADEARATASDRAATLRAAVTNVSDAVRTVDLQVQDTDEMFEPETEAPFQATEQFHIDCHPETAESVVIDVANAGGTVRTVEFKLHEETFRTLQTEAITSAMDRAREQAETIAATEGMAVGEVRHVTTTDDGPGFDGVIDDALASWPDLDLNPDPMTVAAGVEVVYELTAE